MLLLVSGEGPSDLGALRPLEDGYEFVPGPMTILLDRLVEAHLGYSLLDFDAIRFMAKAELTEGTPKRPSRQLRAPGKQRPKESAYYVENAQRLARKAAVLSESESDTVLPVLFRDADGTQSAGRGEWQAKWNSMLKGFRDGESELGVPMLPQPKSEAWLLCACRHPAYQHCHQLEQESGNDRSPNPLKAQLDALLDGASSAVQLADAVRDGRIDPQRIDMPSYNAFRTRLGEVLGQVAPSV